MFPVEPLGPSLSPAELTVSLPAPFSPFQTEKLIESCYMFRFVLFFVVDRNVTESSVAMTTDVSQPLADAGSALPMFCRSRARLLTLTAEKVFQCLN